MRTDLDHLPTAQRSELARVQAVLMVEFDAAISRSTSTSRRSGKILKIILFGSYARDDWVDEPENGYQSDFDLLVIVNHRDLTPIENYWYVAEDKIFRDPSIGRPVNIIVHSLDEVNEALGRGEYFWADLVRDGIALYELPCHPLASPKPLTTADAYEMAAAYFDAWSAKAASAIKLSTFAMAEGEAKDAAFLLHQATERTYICFLLTKTLYFPRSHNLKFLRSLSEDIDNRLVEAWPREARTDRRRFELLKRAYVEARYSDSYQISADDLTFLARAVERLRNLVDVLSREQLDDLRAAAGL